MFRLLRSTRFSFGGAAGRPLRSGRILGILAAAGFISAATQVSAADKSGYTFWNPVPTPLLRELSTDRPDQTESPYTVDAGHWQIEMDVATVLLDRDRSASQDNRTKIWSVAPVNLKAGLTSRVDLQFMFEPYVDSRIEDRRTGERVGATGFGDVTTRLKINFWGNDGGKTALGIMPFIKWPLSASSLRNGKTEGGVILPFAMELPAGWTLGAMTELDFVRNDEGGYEREYVNSVTFSRDLTSCVGVYAEFVAVTGSAPGFKWQGQFDFGFTCAIEAGAQIDFGCNFGVTRSAPDYQPFVGYSRRF